MDQLTQFFGNHVGLFVALGVVVLLMIANEASVLFSSLKRISVADAVRLINDRDPIIVDCRTPAEFRKGHLLNAHNVSLNHFDDEIGRVAKDAARPVLIYCHVGSRSDAAAKMLGGRGYAEVYALRGGINAWVNASMPVTTK